MKKKKIFIDLTMGKFEKYRARRIHLKQLNLHLHSHMFTALVYFVVSQSFSAVVQPDGCRQEVLWLR